MAFTCFECFAISERVMTADHLHDLAVARDARDDGRMGEFVELVARVVVNLRDMPKYATLVQRHPAGPHSSAWPGHLVWLPGTGVSVGPCESCANDMPCVNL